MSNTIPSVSFPLYGSESPAPVRDRLPLRLIELSGCTIDERWCGGDMTSPSWRFYLNLDDGAAVVLRGRAYALRAGYLYAVPAWLRWAARCRGRVRHFNALLDLPSLPRERIIAGCRGVIELAAPGDQLVAAWQDCAIAQAAAGQAEGGLIAHGHAVVWSALARLFALVPDLMPADRDQRFESLRHWAELRLDQPVPRAALARAAGCSEAELARRFAAGLGTSPVRWLRDRRVARAAELLRSSTLPIETVAAQCGLGDRSRFSKVFARVMGVAPAAFRRRAMI